MNKKCVRWVFEDNYIFITNILLLCLMMAHVFYALMLDNEIMAIVASAIWGGVILLRVIFTPASPKEILLYEEGMILKIIDRRPWRESRVIFLKKILDINAKITIGRFPMVRVLFIYSAVEEVEVFFRAKTGGHGFFSFPAEEIPCDVEGFVSDLKEIIRGGL